MGLEKKVLLVTLVLLAVLSMVITWIICAIRKHKFSTKHIILSVVTTLAAFTMLLAPIVFYSNSFLLSHFLNFQKEIKKEVNPERIQGWAVSIITKHNSGYVIPNDEIPLYLKNATELKPEMANLGEGDSSEKFVRVTWGSGFGHWGLIVGDINFKDTSHDFSNMLISQWASGVYFYLETK